MGCGSSKSRSNPSLKKSSSNKPTPKSPEQISLTKERKKNYESPPDISGRDDQEDKDAVMWMRSNDTQTLKKKLNR